MKYSEFIFGNSELSLRLPNLVLLLVYLAYSVLLFRNFNGIICVGMLLFMCSNTYMMDFFGLARGYGLSYGFMIMGLFHLVQSLRTNRDRNLALFNLAALMATLSNFALINFYAAALIAYNMFIIVEITRFKNCNVKKNIFKANRMNIVMAVIAFAVLFEPVRKIVKFKCLNFGGKEGFLQDTVASLACNYFRNYSDLPYENIIIKIVILLPVVVSFFLIIKNICLVKKAFFDNAKSLIIVNLILLMVSTATIIQHHFFNTDYMVGRFTLFLFPLYALNMAFLLEYWFKENGRSRAFVISITILLALLSVNNIRKGLNLYSCGDWEYDAETKNAMKKLVAYHEKNCPDSKSVNMGLNWLFEPTVNYYREIWKVGWMSPADRKGLTDDDAYCYMFQAELDTLKQKKYNIIFSSDRIKTVLISLAK